MTKNRQFVQPNYGKTFESIRRLNPHLWDVDYCLLYGLTVSIKKFANKNALKGMRVIDFGCGAKPYLSLFHEDIEYVGIDTCESRFADIVIVPGQSVPLESMCTDIVISTQVVYLIPDYKFYLQECKRLLRSDGKLFITTHGTWTHHPASGGDYYRFTQDGLRHILNEAGFEIEEMSPIVGTLGTGLHLRQLIFNAWLRKIPFLGEVMAKLYNILTNVRILTEDKFCPEGTRISSPVILVAVAGPKRLAHE